MVGVLNKAVSVIDLHNLALGGSFGDLQKWYGFIKTSTGVKKVYIKTCSTRRGFTGFEPEVECVASRLAHMLGLNCVKYDLSTFKIANMEYKVCVSEDFSNGLEACNIVDVLPNIGSKFGIEKYNYVVNFLGLHQRRILDSILLFDYIIGNKDRHLRNIELLFDDKGNMCIAPIFDNGAGLFSSESEKTILQNIGFSANFVKSKPFLNPHYEQIQLIDRSKICINKVRKEDVYRLVNTYFSGNRAKYINKWLIIRLKELNLLL